MKILLIILLGWMMNVPVHAQISEFSLYPNPFSTSVSANVNSKKFYKTTYTLEVYNLVGQTILTAKGELIFGDNQIPISTAFMDLGIYLFKIMSEGDTLIMRGVKNGIVGVNDLVENNKIKSYPNPIVNELVIVGMDQQSSLKVAVINVLGQVIYTTHSNFTDAIKVNLESLKPAIYFLLITDESDNLVYRKEFQKM